MIVFLLLPKIIWELSNGDGTLDDPKEVNWMFNPVINQRKN